MYERARKRLVCFCCGFNVKAERFPRQQNWRRTCECADTQPSTCVNLVTIGSLPTHQIWAKSVNRILRYGDEGGVHVRTCRDAPSHPWLVERTYLVTPNPHTTIGFWVLTRVVLDSWVVSQIWLDSNSNESSWSWVSRENQGYETSQSRITLIVNWVRVESIGYCLSQIWFTDFSEEKTSMTPFTWVKNSEFLYRIVCSLA